MTDFIGDVLKCSDVPRFWNIGTSLSISHCFHWRCSDVLDYPYGGVSFGTSPPVGGGRAIKKEDDNGKLSLGPASLFYGDEHGRWPGHCAAVRPNQDT